MLSHEIPSSIYIDITWYHLISHSTDIKMSIKISEHINDVCPCPSCVAPQFSQMNMTVCRCLQSFGSRHQHVGSFPQAGLGSSDGFLHCGSFGVEHSNVEQKRWPSVAVKSLGRLYVQPKFGLMIPQPIFWLLGIDTTSCWRDWRHPSFRLQGCWWS